MIPHERLVEIFRALSDPNRLQLFELLLRSDQTNSELMDETGLSQNLLSHHLGVLTDAGLIEVQQSIGDARRRYYMPNLAVPPTLSAWWRQQGLPTDQPCPPLRNPQRVLFLCRMNATRSLLAEAIARHIAPNSVIPYSAGIEAGPMPELALKVLAKQGIPSDDLRAKSYHEVADISFDYLITVCDRVHEPRLPDELVYRAGLHWSLHDPDDLMLSRDEQEAAADALCDAIRQRLTLFTHRLAALEAEEGGVSGA